MSDTSSADYLDKGDLLTARRIATWKLGDASWANLLLRAFFEPDAPDIQRMLADQLGTEVAPR